MCACALAGAKKTSKVLKDPIMGATALAEIRIIPLSVYVALILMATSTLRMKASLLNAVSQGSNQG
jgi:hypothetical protein